MLFALATADYLVLGFYLLAMFGVGALFSRGMHSSRDFFLAGRSMGWFPVGLSIMATLLSALSYSGVPGEAYYEGLKFLLMPLAIWLTLPVVSRAVLPLFYRLELYSIYEYLELRFDSLTRVVSSVVFVLWRLMWLGGVLFAPCKVLVVAAGIDVPMAWLLLTLGIVATLYTYLGGMKAVIWTDVIQAMVMACGIVLIVGAVWSHLDGGAGRVWEVTRELGRSEIVETSFNWAAKWPIWGILPHFVLATLSFYVADQITVQRYLTSRTLNEARRSFTLNCVSVTIMVPALMYVGIALLAFYHDQDERMRPIWVVNVDPETGDSILHPDGSPLIDWNEPLTVETIEALVAQRRLLRPNSKEPFESAQDLLIGHGDSRRIDVAKLATRRAAPGAPGRGEIILNRRAKDELMPRFITGQLAPGLAGLILAALFAASMSSLDSGLNSLCTLMITDFHRRLGWGRRLLAKRLSKKVDELTEQDELKLGRPLVLVIGLAATLFGLLVAQIGNIFDIMIGVVNTFGGPLLAIFLLGIFTRRTTARAALISLVTGTLFTLWLMLGNKYQQLDWMWPFQQALNGIWPLTFGVVFTLTVGYVLSLLTGQRKSNDQLQGLVVGLGRLGVREPEEAFIAIPEIQIPGEENDRWK